MLIITEKQIIKFLSGFILVLILFIFAFMIISDFRFSKVETQVTQTYQEQNEIILSLIDQNKQLIGNCTDLYYLSKEQNRLIQNYKVGARK